MRRQDGLRNAAGGERAHLRQTLQCSRARVRDHPRMLLRRKIAVRKTSVVVRRTRNSVEIDLDHHWRHRSRDASGTARTLSPSPTPSAAAT